MTIEVQEVDTRTAPEDLLREMHEYYIPMAAEWLSDDPPTPFERQAADWRAIRSDQAAPRWLLRDGGEIAASAVAWMNLEQDLDNSFGWIYVRPQDRGKGYARKLAGPLFDRVTEHKRRRFATYVKEGDAPEKLVERAGLKSAYREKRSRLVMADIDMTMMREWIERSGERAADYELLSLMSPFPDDVVDKYCELQFQMNTAPFEDYERDDEVITPKIWREQEEKNAASFYDVYTYVTVHKPTGDYVGSTSVQTDQLQPDQAWQWETVVHPDHRQLGLGRLLKASMIEKIVSDQPKVDRIDTWNAGSNEPMLKINVAMGFKPILITNTFQGDLAAAREKLRM